MKFYNREKGLVRLCRSETQKRQYQHSKPERIVSEFISPI